MTDRPRIWLTRPQADSESFAASLHSHGIECIIQPVLTIEPCTVTIAADDPKPAAILLTSRHAAQALAALPADWRTLPVYCVGDATAHVARDAGCPQAIVGEGGDVFALMPRVAQDLAPGSRLLYLAGDTTRADISTLLGARDITVDARIAYRAVPTRKISNELRNALNGHRLTGVVFFSPRSATLAGKLLAQFGLDDSLSNSHAYCLSLNVANAAATMGFARVHTCHSPTADSMRELIVSLESKKML